MELGNLNWVPLFAVPGPDPSRKGRRSMFIAASHHLAAVGQRIFRLYAFEITECATKLPESV